MDTDTPPDPRGVPAETAVLTLTAPDLAAAFLSARDAPVSDAEVEAFIRARGPGAYIHDDVRRALRAERVRGARAALEADFLEALRAGRILCAGREKGAGATERWTFAPSDWQAHAALRWRDWRTASVRINGRVYGELVFWRPAAPAPREAAPSTSTASNMPNTDTPPDPRGVPADVAFLTLTAPDLIASYLAARDGPLDDIPADVWNTKTRPPTIVHRTEAQRRAIKVKPHHEALEADFQDRVRGGRIIASCIDVNRPELGARDYPAETAALIRWYDGWPKLTRDGPVLADLRFRLALPVPPAEGWDLGEASFALLPDLDKLAWNSKDPTKAVARLAPDLLRAIFARKDLRITGRDSDALMSAPRIVLPRDYTPGGMASITSVSADIMDSVITITRAGGKAFRLEAVRVEAGPGGSNQTPAPAAEPAPLTAPQAPPPAMPGGTTNRGGRPPKFNRVKIGNRLRVIANGLDGLPDDPAELRELVRGIAAEVAGEEPAPSTLADIMKDLELS
jgi:hypothetical protein